MIGTFSSMTILISLSMSGYINGIFTANGADVASLHFLTCSFNISGYMLPLPMIPSAPALLTADASLHPLVHTMPAWMRGILILNSFVTSLANGCIAKVLGIRYWVLGIIKQKVL